MTRGKYIGSVVRHKKRLSAVAVRCPGCGGKYTALQENDRCKHCNEVDEVNARVRKARGKR